VSKRAVLSSDDISRSLKRIAHEILEANQGSSNLLILGIPTRGVILAKRIATAIELADPGFQVQSQVGQLDITMYRDDLSTQVSKTPQETSIPASGVTGANVVLVDDVLFSGRTIRAALDALNDFGRPKTVRVAVLVDRGHRELPIRADFVGKNLPTSRNERISVRLVELDGENEVLIQ
jgi:pyrimidine operon attenuation protein/uracil phosphoribosyltransferase